MADMPTREEASPDWEYRERDFASEEADNIELRKRIAEKDEEIERLKAREARWRSVVGELPRMERIEVLDAMGVEEGSGS